jgi:hypothetical protein
MMFGQKIKGYSIFCDDVRQEVTGKSTYIGVYNGEINFSGTAPRTLPTFAMLINLMINPDISIDRQLKLLVTFPGVELPVVEADLDVKGALADSANRLLPEQLLHMQIPILTRNIVFAESGLIKVRGYVEGEELKFGALKVNFHEPAQV